MEYTAVNTRRARVSAILPNLMLSKGHYSSGEVSNPSLGNSILIHSEQCEVSTSAGHLH